MAQVLRNLPVFYDPNVLVGLETADDAAVYKLTEDLAVIQTLDFFTPVVDDPYRFGQVAAANSLSDVYAMGGKPVLALNIVCFPNCLDPAILGEILRGGADKIKEAGAVLLGGHSVEDQEPKYGLSVMGTVNPNRVLANCGAKPGDVLVLTKPLGTGIINTAIKAELHTLEEEEAVYQAMSTLNAAAAEVMIPLEPNACTDITGFGFLGHALEMAVGSGVTFEIEAGALPVLPGAIGYAQMGIIPAGAYRNAKHAEGKVRWAEDVSESLRDIIADPQTSGGLLIAIPEERSRELIEGLSSVLKTAFAVVGKVVPKGDYPLVFLQ